MIFEGSHLIYYPEMGTLVDFLVDSTSLQRTLYGGLEETVRCTQ